MTPRPSSSDVWGVSDLGRVDLSAPRRDSVPCRSADEAGQKNPECKPCAAGGARVGSNRAASGARPSDSGVVQIEHAGRGSR